MNKITVTEMPVSEILKEMSITKIHVPTPDLIRTFKNFTKSLIKLYDLPQLSEKRIEDVTTIMFSIAMSEMGDGINTPFIALFEIIKHDYPEIYIDALKRIKIKFPRIYKEYITDRAKFTVHASAGSYSRYGTKSRGSFLSPNPKIKKYSKFFSHKLRTDMVANDLKRYLKRTPANVIKEIGRDPGNAKNRPRKSDENPQPYIKDIPPLLRNMILWRGIGKEERKKIISSSETRGYYIFTRNSSTTIRKEITTMFGNDSLLKIKAPIGQRIIPIREWKVINEFEYVIPKGTKLVVDKIYDAPKQKTGRTLKAPKWFRHDNPNTYIIEGHLASIISPKKSNIAEAPNLILPHETPNLVYSVTTALYQGFASVLPTTTTIVNNFHNPIQLNFLKSLW